MPVRPDSGTWTPPVSYPSQITATRYFWEDPDVLPELFTITLATPTFAPLEVIGSNTAYLQQLATYGMVTIQITTANVLNGAPGMFQAAPPYTDVVFNGVDYMVQIGVKFTGVPRIVYDLLNQVGGVYKAAIFNAVTPFGATFGMLGGSPGGITFGMLNNTTFGSF